MLLAAVAGALPGVPLRATSPLDAGLSASDGPAGALRGLSASDATSRLVAAAATAHGAPVPFARVARVVPAQPRVNRLRDAPPLRPLLHRKQPASRAARADSPPH